MNYKAHRIGGVCSATIATTALYHGTLGEPGTYVAIGLAIVGGAVGGLIPDIDHPTSKIGRRIPPVSKIINVLFGHRGFTHTILAAILFTYALFLLSGMFPTGFRGFLLPFSIGLSIGYVSHLILDMLTVSGIPLLYPISRKSFRLAKLRSGRDDLMVSIILISCTGVYLYFLNIL